MSQGLSYTFGWVLLHFLWQGTAIALALGVVLALSRRATPEFRYRLACAGMALMVGAPLVTGWALEVPARAEAANAAPFEPGPALGGLSEAPVFTPSPVARAVVKAVRPGVRGGLDRIAPWLLLPWFLGVLALATRLAGGAGWLYQARKRSRALEGLWLERLEVLRQHLAIPRKVALRVLDELDGPMVVGWLHPLILIPVSVLSGMPATQVELLLTHELAHVARQDYLVNVLQRVVETLLFFHPAVWWVSRRIRLERERCCDAMAADLLGDPVGMAEALTSLEHLRLSGPLPAFAFGATGAPLRERVQALLDLHEPVNRLRLGLALCFILVCAGAGFGLLHLRARGWSRRFSLAVRTVDHGSLYLQRKPEGNEVRFEVKDASAEEVLAALAKADAALPAQEWRTSQEPIIAASARTPQAERYTVSWWTLSRPQFLEYWSRLKARPPVQCPRDTIVVRRDNLALPWDPAEEPPLDVWVPKYADQFSVEAAQLVRAAILEVKSEPPTPGCAQEATRKLPEAILASLKSPEPGMPLVRCGDTRVLEQFAERAKEGPYLPTPNLAFTMDNLAVLNLPAREDKALAQHRAVLEQHMAADRWGLLVRPGKGKGRDPHGFRIAKRETHTPQEAKEQAEWKQKWERLHAEQEVMDCAQEARILQAALVQARQRLATLGPAGAGGTPVPVGFLEVRTGGQHEGTWVSVVVRRLDPAYLEHAPAREGQVLRGLEVALLARIQVLSATRKG